MEAPDFKLIWLYVPMLTHTDPAVRAQARTIFFYNYGDHATTLLNRLQSVVEPALRQHIGEALEAVVGFTREMQLLGAHVDIDVECLGPFRVSIGGRPIMPATWGQQDGGRAGWQKALALLAYLVHCGRRGASREALNEAIWSGKGSASSLSRTWSSLRQAMVNLCGAERVEQMLISADDRYILSPTFYRTDDTIFERAFNLAWSVEQQSGLDAAEPIYRQAMSGYHGPYMAGVTRGSGWMLERRDLLLGNFVIACERLAEHSYMKGRLPACVRFCGAALNEDPAADDVTVWLISAFHELGQRAEFEHAYRRYLRATGLDPTSAEGRRDRVVQTYQRLSGLLAMNKLSR